LPVESLSIGIHAPQEGLMRWGAIEGDEREMGLRMLIASIVGWLEDENRPPTAAWPEEWPPRLDAPDYVGQLTRRLHLSRERYEFACEAAKELVEGERFQRAVALVSKALMLAPRLGAEELELLRAQTAYADAPEVVLA
jgi:hypothetical protein